MSKTVIRHKSAPNPNGCRWCGHNPNHGMIFVKSVGYHLYAIPTQAQIKARMLARRVTQK